MNTEELKELLAKSVDDVMADLDELDLDSLKALKALEAEGSSRKTLIEQIDKWIERAEGEANASANEQDGTESGNKTKPAKDTAAKPPAKPTTKVAAVKPKSESAAQDERVAKRIAARVEKGEAITLRDLEG